MTNVSFPVFVHFHLSIFLLASSVPCIAHSHLEDMVQTSPVHPIPWDDTLSHT